MEELDEFGIPIKKTNVKKPIVDEFGIPVKKKDGSNAPSSSSTIQKPTLESEMQKENGSSVTPNQNKFRLPTEQDFTEMQQRGLVPSPSEINKRKSVDVEINRNELLSKETPLERVQKLPIVPIQKKAEQIDFETRKSPKPIPAQKIIAEQENYNFTEEKKQALKNEIDKKIEAEDLLLEKPFAQYSSYNRIPEFDPVSQQYIETPKDNFISENFKEDELTSLGIDASDFDGFINKKGYKQDFLNRQEKGLFSNENGRANPILAKEANKLRMLNLYIQEKNRRANLKIDLESNKQNLEKSFSEKVKPSQVNLFDTNKVENYVQREMPTLYKKLKERDLENNKILESHNKGEANLIYGVKQNFKAGWNGLVDRLNNSFATIYDKAGLDTSAEEVRMLNEENLLLRPDTREVGYVSGKKANYLGVNYIVDDNGQVYDMDKKIRVTDLMFKETYDTIKELSNKGENDYIFSPQGTAIQASGVLGDMIVQIAITKGIGGVASGLSKLGLGANLAKIPMSQSMSSAIIAQSTLGYSSGLEDTLRIAKEQGLNDADAQMLASDSAQRMAILYALTAPISPQTKATEALFGNETKSLIKKAILAYKETGKKGFVETIKKGITELSKKATVITEEGVKELFQENIQQADETTLVNAETNRQAGKQIQKDTISADDFVNTSILSFLTGGLASQAKLPNLFPNNSVDQLKTLNQLSSDIPKFEKNLKEMVSNGVIENDVAENLKKDMDAFSKNHTKIPNDVAPEKAMDLMRKLQEVNDLELKKKTLDKSFHKDIDEQIQSKRDEASAIYSQSKEKPKEEQQSEEIIAKEPIAVAEKTTTQTSRTTSTEVATQSVQENKNNDVFYTGRGKKYEDLSKTKGDFIFFSKDKNVSEWYGGDINNVTEAKIDTSNFLDLTDQAKKTNFVKENFSDQDIESLYKKEISFEEDRDRFNKLSRKELIEKYRKRAEENRFSGDGKEQEFLLKKIKEKGFSGVALQDTFFGKLDTSYVVLDKSIINKNETVQNSNTSADGNVQPRVESEDNTAKLLNTVSDEGYNTFINKYIDVFNEKLGSNADILVEDVAKIYHDAKNNGSNPELVKSIEELLKNEATPTNNNQINEPNENGLFELLSDDNKELANQISDPKKKDKFIRGRAIQDSPTKANNYIERENAKLTLENPNATTEEKVAAKLNITEDKPFNSAQVSDVLKDIKSIEEKNRQGLSFSEKRTLKYLEEIENENPSPSNIEPNADVRPRVEPMEQVGKNKQPTAEIVAEESVQSANDVKPIEGEAKITKEPTLEDISNFLNENFKQNEANKGTKETSSKKEEETKQAKGFISIALDKLTTSLKDFQGRGVEYSKQTYDRIVNEAKEGILNISAIPPVQIWKDPKTGEFVILAGHSRTKAFSDLANGEIQYDSKYKKSDFTNINAQIVEAETLQEAQKIAQESNQGAVQTVVDNAKYVRENLLPTFNNFNQAKTKLKSLYGSAWARIYAYANLNPRGKAMQMLKQFQEANESDSNDKSKKIAEWTGKARQEFSNLTDAHENEIFDYLSKNDKIKTYTELGELLNRRVNGLEEFNVNEPLNFEQKVGRGSNEVEIVKQIQDLKNRDAEIKKKIRELQSFGKNINDIQKKQIKDLTAESIKINTVDIPNAQIKQKQARVADAEQFDIFSQINEQIENGNITPEQVDEFVNDDRKAEEIEPIVEAIEVKAKSDKKVELEEVVNNVENQIEREPADRGNDGGVQKYSGKPLVQQENKRPGIVVQAESKMPPTNNFVSKNYEIDEVQKQGVNSALSLFENGGKSFLLADGTGVGKTRQILVIAKEYLNKFGGKVLIISENTTILTKNFANDAKALGIDMNEFEFGTYNDLRTGKKGKDNYGLVIYDEAHNLKNQESGKAIAAGNIKSKNNMYVTATPMDTIGSAVYFISEVSGVTEEQAYNMLGLNVKKQKDTITGQEVKIVTLQEGVSPADIKRNIVKIREEIISKGAMLRREYPFYGEFVEDKISLTEEQSNEQDEIESNWDDRIEYESMTDDGRVNFRKKMNLSGQKSGELSRWSESTKIKYTFKEVVKAIKEGKKVVVIAEGVNETTITAIDKVVPGFLSELSKMLKAEGYKVAEIFGKSDKGEANDKFQANEVDVVLGTAKSASTGIDLDDQNGDSPRVLFMVTPNYSGNVFQQILGRVSRRNTKSPAQIRLLFNESNIDARRKQIVNGKLQTLKAIQEGIIDDEIEIDIQETPTPSVDVVIDLEGITLENISEKAFVVKGDTRPIKDNIKAIGGKYNPKYGWMFPISRKAEVQEMLNKISNKKPVISESQQLKDKLNAEVDKIADKIKDFLPGIKDPDVKAQGLSQDAIIDLIASAVKNLINSGIEIDEAIKQVVSSLKERFGDLGFEIDQNKVKAIVNPPKNDFERKEGKKSVATRLATGNSSIIKKTIADFSLDYEIENQDLAKKKAEQYVDKVGIDEAFKAAQNEDIKGAEKAFVYGKIISDLQQEIAENQDDIERVMSIQEGILKDAIKAFDEKGREYGRFLSAINKIINSSDGMYNLSYQINKYKNNNGDKIPKDVLEKFEIANAKLKELEAKLLELEKRKEEESSVRSIEEIIESISRKNKIDRSKGISSKTKAKELADKLRSYKIGNSGITKSSFGVDVVYDAAIEIIALAIEKSPETGETIGQIIKKGIAYIRNQNLPKDEENEAVAKVFNAFEQSETTQRGIRIDKDGKLRIPHSLIREKVINGIDNIDDLVTSVKADVEEIFPDEQFTDRQIRDAITDYGKTTNPTKDDVEREISIMKSLGKIASGLEDAYSGKRPLRSGLQRRIPTDKERLEMRKLKELLRDLPMDDADLQKSWKTALDAIKTRLKNEIRDLDSQIANREKRKPEKKVIEYDQDANNLKAERDAKREILDELVGKPELTEEQKIEKAVLLLEKTINENQEKIDRREIQYKTKPTPVTSEKIEELRAINKALLSEIEQMREEAGLVEAKRLEMAKKSALKRIEELKRRLREGDFSKKERRPLKADAELARIRNEMVLLKEVYDKEAYKLELKNQSVTKKIGNLLLDILNIPKILSFTIDMSFVGIQGGIQAFRMARTNPKLFGRVFLNTLKAMANPKIESQYAAEIKSDPDYELMRVSKLAITEANYKATAGEEIFQHNILNATFDAIGNELEEKGRTKEAYIVKNYVNVTKPFERGQTYFLNQMRIHRFKEGVAILKNQGKNEIDNVIEYRKVAAAVNTLTGRANTEQQTLAALRSLNGTIFSSFANWLSVINQLNPYWYATLTPTARKMAISDLMTFIVGAGGLLSLTLLSNDSDDDDEEKWTIELDPRSSDFMLAKKGNLRIDPWQTKKSHVVFLARILPIIGGVKNQDGEIVEFGVDYKDKNRLELAWNYASNKFSPGVSALIDYVAMTEVKEYGDKKFRENKYGEDFKASRIFIPLYIQSIKEVAKEQPELTGKAINVLNYFGLINIGIYGEKKGVKNMPDFDEDGNPNTDLKGSKVSTPRPPTPPKPQGF